MSHDDFHFEPVPGLPAVLPPGERLLWQGQPRWKSLAVQAYHIRKVGVYFGLLMVWRVSFGAYHGDGATSIALSCGLLAALALIAIGILGVLAFFSARAAVFSITSRRVLLRHGIAVPLTLHLPFKDIQSVALKCDTRAVGDIVIDVTATARVGYLITWPYLKPGHFARPQPSLRAVNDVSVVAALLANALALDAGQTVASPAPDLREDPARVLPPDPCMPGQVEAAA